MNSLIVFLCLAIYFTILLVLNIFRKKTFSGKNAYLELIKPLIPSWKFFDDFEETRLFYFRFKHSENSNLSDWIPIYQAPMPKLKNLFINPATNIILSAHSHISILLNDISDTDIITDSKDLENHISYKLAKNYVHFYLQQKHHFVFTYQFKISVSDENLTPIEDILISPLYFDFKNDKKGLNE